MKMSTLNSLVEDVRNLILNHEDIDPPSRMSLALTDRSHYHKYLSSSSRITIDYQMQGANFAVSCLRYGHVRLLQAAIEVYGSNLDPVLHDAIKEVMTFYSDYQTLEMFAFLSKRKVAPHDSDLVRYLAGVMSKLSNSELERVIEEFFPIGFEEGAEKSFHSSFGSKDFHSALLSFGGTSQLRYLDSFVATKCSKVSEVYNAKFSGQFVKRSLLQFSSLPDIQFLVYAIPAGDIESADWFLTECHKNLTDKQRREVIASAIASKVKNCTIWRSKGALLWYLETTGTYGTPPAKEEKQGRKGRPRGRVRGETEFYGSFGKKDEFVDHFSAPNFKFILRNEVVLGASAILPKILISCLHDAMLRRDPNQLRTILSHIQGSFLSAAEVDEGILQLALGISLRVFLPVLFWDGDLYRLEPSHLDLPSSYRRLASKRNELYECCVVIIENFPREYCRVFRETLGTGENMTQILIRMGSLKLLTLLVEKKLIEAEKTTIPEIVYSLLRGSFEYAQYHDWYEAPVFMYTELPEILRLLLRHGFIFPKNAKAHSYSKDNPGQLLRENLRLFLLYQNCADFLALLGELFGEWILKEISSETVINALSNLPNPELYENRRLSFVMDSIVYIVTSLKLVFEERSVESLKSSLSSPLKPKWFVDGLVGLLPLLCSSSS